MYLILQVTKDKEKLMNELSLEEKQSEDEDDDSSSKKRVIKEETKLIEKIEEEIN